MGLPIALYKRFTVDSTDKRSGSVAGAYHAGDRVYVASFIKKKDVLDPVILQETIRLLQVNALQLADASFTDAITSAIAAETRIAAIAKSPSDWHGIVATIQYKSSSSDHILVFDDIRRDVEIDPTERYYANIIGLEITPITQITIGIDPYHRGTYLRNLSFESNNI